MEASSAFSHAFDRVDSSIIGLASDQICEQSNVSQLSNDLLELAKNIVLENSAVAYDRSRQEIVGKWVQDTQNYHRRNHVHDNATQEDVILEEEDEETESDSYSEKNLKWHKMPLKMRCEWPNCPHKDTNVERFVKHVSNHIPEISIRTTEDDYEVYVCLWAACDYETPYDKEIVRHVNFHAYHTKLKSAGRNMGMKMKLPKCTLNSEGRNILPDLPSEFSCGWQGCTRAFNNSQMYFYHVAGHVMASNKPRKRRKRVKDIACNWLGCTGKFYDVYKLADHVKVHTQERVIGCPSCGAMFASPTKFLDHCQRQDSSAATFRCPSCPKTFTSERLLRDHMRLHVSRYKCTFCDMTCVTPSSLSLHIRYRHLKFRPFKCSYCGFAMKTQRELKNHMNVHILEPLFSCEEEGCDFTCRTPSVLNKHVRKEHYGDDCKHYCCHICNYLCTRGSMLTKHLFKFHNFQWTPGHIRFRYTRDEDGYFRLKPYRLETFEVTEEILKQELNKKNKAQHPCLKRTNVKSRCQYNLRHRKRELKDDDEDDDNDDDEDNEGEEEEDEEAIDDPEEMSEGEDGDTPGEKKKIVITIEEFNVDGEVVHCQTIETEEVPIERGADSVVCYYPTEGSDRDTDSENFEDSLE